MKEMKVMFLGFCGFLMFWIFIDCMKIITACSVAEKVFLGFFDLIFCVLISENICCL